MNSSAVISHAVGDLDNNLITPIALDSRTWNSGRTAIIRYGQAEAVSAVEVARGVRNGQAVFADLVGCGPRVVVVRVDVKPVAPRLSVARAVAAASFGRS
jgi:hypothetical protein